MDDRHVLTVLRLENCYDIPQVGVFEVEAVVSRLTHQPVSPLTE